MLIDWFTIVAQLINFAILVVALKFLLYDRLMDVMEKRRRSIAQQEAEAEEGAREAEDELARLRKDRRELENQRDEMLEQTRREADERRRQLLQEARAEVQRQEDEWRASVRDHQERLLSDLQRLTGEKAVTVTRRLLADMADRSLQEVLIATLVERVGQIPEDERTAIAESVRSGDTPIVVRSAFDPSAADRENVDKVLGELVGELDRPVRWERDPGLVCGVVLQAGAHTVGWSVEGYLEDVERDFAELLRSESGVGGQESEE